MTTYQGRDAVIVGAVRTPVGKGKANGALHDVLPADLLAHSLRELVARTGLDPAKVEAVTAARVTELSATDHRHPPAAAPRARGRGGGAAGGWPHILGGTAKQAISFAAQGVLA